MSSYRMVDTNSPKGHKTTMSSIQGTLPSHQDLDLAIYIDNSNTGFKHFVIRNHFSMAMWHSSQQVTKLPIPSKEQHRAVPDWCFLTYKLFLWEHNTPAWLHNTSLSFLTFSPNNHPFPRGSARKSLYASACHGHRAKQTSEQKGRSIYKITPDPWKFQPWSLSVWPPAAQQIPHALWALQGGVLAYRQV